MKKNKEKRKMKEQAADLRRRKRKEARGMTAGATRHRGTAVGDASCEGRPPKPSALRGKRGASVGRASWLLALQSFILTKVM